MKQKKRKPGPLAVCLTKITWFGLHQSTAWLRQRGLMTPEMESAYALFPRVTIADEDVQEIAKPEKDRRREWSPDRAYFGPLRGVKTVNVPPDQAKNMAALLRMAGYVMSDVQRSSTALSRANVLEKVDLIDLMASV